MAKQPFNPRPFGYKKVRITHGEYAGSTGTVDSWIQMRYSPTESNPNVARVKVEREGQYFKHAIPIEQTSLEPISDGSEDAYKSYQTPERKPLKDGKILPQFVESGSGETGERWPHDHEEKHRQAAIKGHLRMARGRRML